MNIDKMKPIGNDISVTLKARMADRINLKDSRPMQTDEVIISDESRSFSSIINSLKNEIRTETPEEIAHTRHIKGLVENNQYNVDGRAIARKVIEHFSSLIDKDPI